MKSYFKLEFKKAMFSWRTVISILIILAIFIKPVIQEYRFPWPGLDGVDYYIRICRFTFLGLIAPAVVGLTYSTSIVKDIQSGLINKLLEIIDMKAYISVKLVVNALVNFIVFAFSHGLIMLGFIIAFGINSVPLKDVGSGALPYSFLSVYGVSKVLYLLIILLLTSLSAAAFSVSILAIITVTQSKLLAYILPVSYTIVTGIFFEIWSLNSVVDFNVAKLFNIVGYSTNGITIFVYDLILVLLGVAAMYLFGYKKSLDLREVVQT